MPRIDGERLGEPRRKLAIWLVVLPVLTMVAGCAGNSSSPTRTPTISATSRATNAVAAQTHVAMTNSGEVGAATPAGSPPSQISPNASDESSTAPSGLIFATPPNNEPILKDAPTSAEPSGGYTPIPSSFDSDGDGFMSVPEYINALQVRYPTYAWPTGHKLDLNAVVAGLEAQAQKVNMQFENGSERTSLGFAFLCAWQYTLLDATYANDSALVAESVKRLQTELRSNPSMAGIRQYEEDAISRAELGDPGPLQQTINGNGCASQPWEAGTPVASPVHTAGSSALSKRPPPTGEKTTWHRSLVMVDAAPVLPSRQGDGF